MYVIVYYESILYLRARNLHTENRLDFIHVGRIVDAIAAALYLRDDGYVCLYIHAYTHTRILI